MKEEGGGEVGELSYPSPSITGELIRMAVPEKAVVAAAPLAVVPPTTDPNLAYTWGYLRIDVRNLSITVNHHFEYQ